MLMSQATIDRHWSEDSELNLRRHIETISPTIRVFTPQPACSDPIGVYLAARYDHLSMMQQYKHRLEQAGFMVTARWVTGAHDAYETHEDKRPLFAMEDLEDIRSCDWLVSFTEQPGSGSTRGGRHTELGIALALKKRCIIIGPRENVFYYLPQIMQYQTWEEFYGREIIGS